MAARLIGKAKKRGVAAGEAPFFRSKLFSRLDPRAVRPLVCHDATRAELRDSSLKPIRKPARNLSECQTAAATLSTEFQPLPCSDPTPEEAFCDPPCLLAAHTPLPHRLAPRFLILAGFIMSRPPELDRNQDATCYIGNIDDRATDAIVWELMIQAGPLVNLHLPKDRITQSHQGYAFAEFQTEQDADYACKVMNGLKLYGKPIRVNKASQDRKQIDIGANLFVGSLDAAVDERLLYETFSAFGGITGLPKVARDPTSGEPKGFAFVSFDSFEAADAAIEALNGQFLLNKNITVDYAIKKDSKNGERHGTAAERLLAAQARKNNALPAQPYQYAQQPGQPPAPYSQAPAGAPMAANGNAPAAWNAYAQQPQQPPAYPQAPLQQPTHPAAAYPQNPPAIHMNPGAPPAYPPYR